MRKTWQTIALLLSSGLAFAFVVSFALGMRRDDRGGEVVEARDQRIVPGIASGRRVEVLNAADRTGLARGATETLRAAGFDVVYFGNAARNTDDISIVLDRVGKPDIARAVAARLNIGRTETRLDSTRLVEVTVILGTDWLPKDSTSGRF